MARVQHRAGGRMMTKQADAAASDINAIVRRARQAGTLPPGRGVQGRYGDFTGVGSFHEALLKVEEAEMQFLELPARVRQACSNDVGEFLDKCQDEEQLEMLLELGLDPKRVPKPKEEEPPKEPAAETPKEPQKAPPAS